MEIRQAPSQRGPYRTTFTPQDVTDAYNLVKNQKLPVERVAKQFGIPVTTLKERVRGKVDNDCVKSGTSSMFTMEQEAFLCRHVSTMAEIGYGYSRRETVNIAKDYAIHLGIRTKEHPLSLKWIYKSIGRWPELRVKKPRSLEIARAKSATRPVITRYFEELHAILTKYNLMDQPNRTYNIDENGLNLAHKPPKSVAGAHYKTQSITAGKSKTITVIGGANAVGNQVPLFFIFPGQRMVPELLDGATVGVTGTVSPSGWSNIEIFSRYIQEHLKPLLPATDGHKRHCGLVLIDWARENHICLFFSLLTAIIFLSH